jgi:DNA-binding transcriptional MerR regulator
MSPRSTSKTAGLITLKEFASIVGEEPSTIDYWTKLGLLVCRRRGNARVYDLETNRDRCRKIRQRKDDGLNLAAIKREFDGRG